MFRILGITSGLVAFSAAAGLALSASHAVLVDGPRFSDHARYDVAQADSGKADAMPLILLEDEIRALAATPVALKAPGPDAAPLTQARAIAPGGEGFGAQIPDVPTVSLPEDVATAIATRPVARPGEERDSGGADVPVMASITPTRVAPAPQQREVLHREERTRSVAAPAPRSAQLTGFMIGVFR